MVRVNVTPGGLPVTRRKEAFRLLVEAQDRGQSIPDSRRAVADRFALSEDDVRAIEDEGVQKDWPPLA